MEPNEFSGSSTQGQSGGSSAGTGYGAGGSNTSSTTSGVGSKDEQGLTDRARDLAGSAQDKLADVGSTVRDRTGNLKDSLAEGPAIPTGLHNNGPHGNTEDETPPPPRGGDHHGVGGQGGPNPGSQLPPPTDVSPSGPQAPN